MLLQLSLSPPESSIKVHVGSEGDKSLWLKPLPLCIIIEESQVLHLFRGYNIHKSACQNNI